MGAKSWLWSRGVCFYFHNESGWVPRVMAALKEEEVCDDERGQEVADAQDSRIMVSFESVILQNRSKE